LLIPWQTQKSLIKLLIILILQIVDFLLSETTDYELALFIIFSLAFIIQLFYYIVIYARVPFARSKPLNKDLEKLHPVSVVICTRNEEENLSNFLPSILEQEYNEYEVIVVNDCSEDDTDMLLQRLMEKYKHLRTTTITRDSKFTHGKKLALTVGIKAAKYNWLLLTDADCKPDSNQWLTMMASNFNDNSELVLGYSGYIPFKGLLNRFIRFDTFFIALQYLSFALFGKPYMGVGRNLAYRKDLFIKNRGFASHSHILSGDDDLFVHEVATKKNTVVEYRHNAHTRSLPCTSFECWFTQKKRHLKSSPHYRFSAKLWLALEPFSRICFWGTGIAMLALEFKLYHISGVIAFRLLLMSIIIKIAMNRLSEKKIFLTSLIYDLFSPLFYFVLMLVVRFSPKRGRWK
jgi:cellulose synthase/poly-beta-1,6-N-acetylglucosamine synthase-like glycosyltransferase